jgi:hypothetical protein
MKCKTDGRAGGWPPIGRVITRQPREARHTNDLPSFRLTYHLAFLHLLLLEYFYIQESNAKPSRRAIIYAIRQSYSSILLKRKMSHTVYNYHLA